MELLLGLRMKYLSYFLPYFCFFLLLNLSETQSDNPRCRVYTYWEDIYANKKISLKQRIILYNHTLLVKLWARNWYSNGWWPELLGIEDAKKHPRYHEFLNNLHQLPTVNSPQYEAACYIRWLAFQMHGGGVFSDYDIANFKISQIPKAAGLCGRGDLISYPDFLPMLIFGDVKAIGKLVDTLSSYKWHDGDRYEGRPHSSDMTIIRQMRMNLFTMLLPNPKNVPHFATAYHFEMTQRLPHYSSVTKAEWARRNLINNLIWNHKIYILVDDFENHGLKKPTAKLLEPFTACSSPSVDDIQFMIEPLRPSKNISCNSHIVTSIKSDKLPDILIVLMEDPVSRVVNDFVSFNRFWTRDNTIEFEYFLRYHANKNPVITSLLGRADFQSEEEISIALTELESRTPIIVLGLSNDLYGSKLLLEYGLGILLPSLETPNEASKMITKLSRRDRQLIKTLNLGDFYLYTYISKHFSGRLAEITGIESSLQKVLKK